MVNTNISAIILAAGKGTRMKSNIPKVLHKIAGKTMLMHSIDLCRKNKIKNIVVVLGYDHDQVEKVIPDDVTIIKQDKQLGTAHALMQAKEFFLSKQGKLLILYADVPLIREETIKKLIRKENRYNGLSVIGFISKKPKGYGRIILSNKNTVECIVEEVNADKNQRAINLCNSGIIFGELSTIYNLLSKISLNKKKKEYLLTDIFQKINKDNLCTKLILVNEEEVMGVNNRQELADAESIFQKKIRKKMLYNGITMLAPETIYFSHDTKIYRDVTLGSNIYFGEDVVVYSGTKIESYCHIEGAIINKNCKIGPFARIRPKSIIKRAVNIGNYVEVKNSIIGEESKVNHLAYVGDTNIGSNTNIGAGTIMCNYDGEKKHKTRIGSKVFVGSNSSLVAPIYIKNNTFIAAGSVVTKGSNSGDLIITRAKQRNIKNGNVKIRSNNLSKKK